jgi:hypothetical protein
VKLRRGAAIAAIVAVIVLVVVWRTHHREDHAAAGGSDAVSLQGRDGFHLGVGGSALAGRRIAGMVLLGDATAPGVTVHAVRAHGAIELPRVVTDATGRFDLGVLPADRYLVVAEKPQTAGTSLLVDLRDPTVKSDQVALVLHACEASIHGVVRDAAGGPIGGARVARSQDTLLWGEGTDTDASGNYELCTVRQDVELVASADGYALESTTLKVSGRIRQDFMLSPEGEIAGQVVRATDKVPVPDAVVTANPEIDVLAPMLYAITDQDGKFHFAGAHVGRYLLNARAPGLTTRRSVPVIAQIGAPEDDVVCEVAALASIAGRVVEGGKGVAGAAVMLDQRGLFRTDLEAITQADGSFWIDRLEPGEYTAKVPLYDMPEDAPPIHVETTDVTGVVLAVTSRASIAGRVTHAGKPVEGADVRVGYHHVVTDADGRYEVRGLEAGTHIVYAESPRLGVFSPGPTVELGAHDHKAGVDVDMQLAGSISGKVVDQDGAAASGVLVNFSLLRGRDYGAATTAEDGSFTVTSLAGGGAYTYEVRAGYNADIAYPPVNGKRFAPIAVADGKTRVTGVTIKIRRELSVIAGRVVSTGGEPVPDAIVRADLIGPAMGSRYEASVAAARTDQNGAFRLADIVPGDYVLRALTTHGEQTLRDVDSGRKDVVIRVPDPGEITGTLEGFTAPPAVVAALQEQPFTSFQGVVHGNAFAIRGVPPGKYEVKALSSSGNGSALTSVAEHGKATVVLHTLGFGSLAGTVVNAATHRPAAGIGCTVDEWADRVRTDGAGRFHIDHVPAGDVEVFCVSGPMRLRAYETVKVTRDQTTNVELAATSLTITETEKLSHVGMDLEEQFSETLVASVERGGPAERAGLRVGDVIVTMGGKEVTTLHTEDIEALPPGTAVTFGIDRDDKRETVTVTLAPP